MSNNTELQEQTAEETTVETVRSQTPPAPPKDSTNQKTLLTIGAVALAVLAVIIFLVWRSGYSKAEAKYKTEVEAKATEIIQLQDELNKARQINIGIIKTHVKSIGELATAEYNYTNAAQFENSKSLLGVNLPFTKKSFILRYNGTIKAGFDITDPDVQVAGNTIVITLPEPKILSHEIDFKNAEVLNERSGLFNSVSVADVNEFYAQNKDTMDTQALENNLKETALANGKALIESSLNANPAIQGNYIIKVETK